MKNLATLLKFLYDSQEETDISDDLLNLAEQIETENRIEVKKGPLNKALAAIDVHVPDNKLVPDYGSVLAHFDTAEEYQDAVNKLESPNGMEKLAELGWVMNIGGNSEPGETNYRIRFLALELHDEEPKNDQKQVDIDKTMKDVADTFSHDKEDPKRKMQKAAESKEKNPWDHPAVRKVVKGTYKRVNPREGKKDHEVSTPAVNRILGRKSKL